MKNLICMLCITAAATIAATSPARAAPVETSAGNSPVPVTVKNFQRAESDKYFGDTVKLGGFGKFFHYRTPTPIEDQKVVKMNRDTLYSAAVFDLDAGPVTVTLPEAGKRFMSMLVINEDHYAPVPVAYAPGSFTLTKEQAGTRYIMAAVRTLADFENPADVKAANAVQDKIAVQQAGTGKFEVPNWDPVSQKKIRDTLAVLQSMSGATTERRMGKKEDVDPILHLLATATGWGLNPPEAAVYNNVYPKANDGKTVHALTARDVPVDGFWSISVYNEKNFFEKNDLKSYSINNLTATPNPDGSFTIQFGGCTKATPNCLVTPAKWSYQVRQYRPRKEIIDGSWKFPQAQPVR
jgi:para-nitrobenzyl esterase